MVVSTRGFGRRAAGRVAAVALCAAGLIAAGVLPANASRYSDLQQQIQSTRSKINAANAKERSLLAQIAASDARAQQLDAQIGRLNDKLQGAETALAALNDKLAVAQSQLLQANDDLNVALNQLELQRSQVDARAAALYENSLTTYTTVLLGHLDFHDFMAASAYEGRVLGSDVSILNDIEQAKNDVEARQNDLQSQRDALAQQQDAITAQMKQINAIKQQQLAARGQIAAERATRQHLLSQIQGQKQYYVSMLNAELAESQSIESLLNNAQSGEIHVAGAGHGYFVWPTTGPITSPYGWRIHPIYHYRSFHTGIDIGAPIGQNVLAARHGEIISVGYMGAYGLTVIMDNGNHFATVYAHLSRVYVRVGQDVSTRQVIAAVGNTGWSTGPHLHFEVRIDGQHVNPITYL